jgi:predicted acyl esterase
LALKFSLRKEAKKMIEIIAEKDVPIPMRDGLKLAANIFRPAGPGKFPVIIAFTAFSKDGLWSSNRNGWGMAYEPYSPTITGSTAFEAEDPLFWVNHEYALAIVDPRGFYRSPGQIRTAEIDGVVGEQAVLHEGLWARDMYDAIEWAGTQEWSSGNVGMSGVSILGFSQWRAAALNPPHLKAFIPWEAQTDYYRDVMFRGGVPDTEWGKLIGRHRLTHNPAWPLPEKEDPPPPVVKEEDEFLAEITAPALICATWSNHGVHTRGAFRAFRKISSLQKWLYTHGRQEWSEFYTAEAQTIRKLFFDHFLKGIDSRILDIPGVRLETRETLDRYSVRHEKDFPVPGTKYRRFFLDATDGRLKPEKNSRQSKADYDSAAGKAVFDHKFDRDTELTGYMSLKLWVSPEEAEDMDIFVTLRKLDRSGQEVFFDAWLMLGRYPVAFGWLRLSHRELDKEKSTPWEPYLKSVTGPGETMKPGQIVPCEVPILPSGTLFREGETLRLVVSGIFGGGEIKNVPYGFNASVNKGTHSIYTGGKYGSYLLVPVVPLR